LSDFPPGVDVFDGAEFIVDVALLSILTAAGIQTIKPYYAVHSRLEIFVFRLDNGRSGRKEMMALERLE